MNMKQHLTMILLDMIAALCMILFRKYLRVAGDVQARQSVLPERAQASALCHVAQARKPRGRSHRRHPEEPLRLASATAIQRRAHANAFEKPARWRLQPRQLRRLLHRHRRCVALLLVRRLRVLLPAWWPPSRRHRDDCAAVERVPSGDGLRQQDVVERVPDVRRRGRDREQCRGRRRRRRGVR